jgi:hypothetical protein
LLKDKLEIDVVRQEELRIMSGLVTSGLQSEIVLIDYEGLFNHLPYEMQTIFP